MAAPTQNSDPTASAPGACHRRLVRHWYVCHPDGQDLGLIAPCFATEAEAISQRDRWNMDVPGHYVMGITAAPPEFSSLPDKAPTASTPTCGKITNEGRRMPFDADHITHIEIEEEEA